METPVISSSGSAGRSRASSSRNLEPNEEAVSGGEGAEKPVTSPARGYKRSLQTSPVSVAAGKAEGLPYKHTMTKESSTLARPQKLASAFKSQLKGCLHGPFLMRFIASGHVRSSGFDLRIICAKLYGPTVEYFGELFTQSHASG